MDPLLRTFPPKVVFVLKMSSVLEMNPSVLRRMEFTQLFVRLLGGTGIFSASVQPRAPWWWLGDPVCHLQILKETEEEDAGGVSL